MLRLRTEAVKERRRIMSAAKARNINLYDVDLIDVPAYPGRATELRAPKAFLD